MTERQGETSVFFCVWERGIYFFGYGFCYDERLREECQNAGNPWGGGASGKRKLQECSYLM